MEQTKNNTPQIRFNEFDDEWKKKCFSEVFSLLQNNTLSRTELNYESGDAKNIHYGDVLIKFGEYIDVQKEKLPYLNNDGLARKFSKSLLQNGDVIFADTAEDEAAGKCTELQNPK